MSNPDYEKIVHKLAFAAIHEQRRRRRWRIFFLFVFFAFLTPIFITALDINNSEYSNASGEAHTAIVKLSGIIASGEAAGSDNVIAGLKAAFEHEQTKAVILEINSPGGSPVQASYIYDEIRRLKDKYPSIPIYTVISDIAASGGYFVAAAADSIFVNPSSLVGSIGVRMDNFGFVDLMDKIGVERRLLTAGKDKGLLDPFSPTDNAQKAHIQTMLHEVHQHFIEAVKTGRGDRLGAQTDLFSGLIWTGAKAIELGLADDFGSSQTIARDLVKIEKLVDFTPQGELVDRFIDRLSASISRRLMHLISSKLY